VPFEIADIRVTRVDEDLLCDSRAVSAATVDDDFIGLRRVDFRQALTELVVGDVQCTLNVTIREFLLTAYIQDQ
jgi:hypothetical protein